MILSSWQDVFVEVGLGIERWREPAAIKGWLATIAVRTVRRRLRRRRVWRFFGIDRDADSGGLIDRAASPVDRLLLRAVYRVLDEMPVEIPASASTSAEEYSGTSCTSTASARMRQWRREASFYSYFSNPPKCCLGYLWPIRKLDRRRRGRWE